jgi:hypothetical protein
MRDYSALLDFSVPIDHLHSLRDYRKNTFPELASDVRRRIADEWGRCFEEWGYPV